MLQIIGWLGCLYLVVKGFEIAGGANFRDASGRPTTSAKNASTIAWIGAFVFAVMLLLQGGAFEQVKPTPAISEPLSQAEAECINKANGDDKAVMACVGK